MTEYDRLAQDYQDAGKRLVAEARRCLIHDIRELYPTATDAVVWFEAGDVFLYTLEGADVDQATAEWEKLQDMVSVYIDDVWMIEHHADPTITDFTISLR